MNELISYTKQRFAIWPWFVLSFYFLLLSSVSLEGLNLTLYIFTLLFLFSFRLLDDLMCRQNDLHNLRKSPFQFKNIPIMFTFSCLAFAVSCVSIYWFTQSWRLAFILLNLYTFSILLYWVLKNSSLINLISILKYPVLIYILGEVNLNEFNFILSMIVFSLFLFFEVLEEYFFKIYKKSFYILLLSLLVLNFQQGALLLILKKCTHN